MAKAHRSGIVVTDDMLPIIRGMVARGDRRHDIGAWFGLNQGRIKEVEDGDYGSPTPAPANQLPPAGLPGPRARKLRHTIAQVRQLLSEGKAIEASAEIQRAIADFDTPV